MQAYKNCNIDAIVIGKCTVFFHFGFYSLNIYTLVFQLVTVAIVNALDMIWKQDLMTFCHCINCSLRLTETLHHF